MLFYCFCLHRLFHQLVYSNVWSVEKISSCVLLLGNLLLFLPFFSDDWRQSGQKTMNDFHLQTDSQNCGTTRWCCHTNTPCLIRRWCWLTDGLEVGFLGRAPLSLNFRAALSLQFVCNVHLWSGPLCSLCYSCVIGKQVHYTCFKAPSGAVVSLPGANCVRSTLRGARMKSLNGAEEFRRRQVWYRRRPVKSDFCCRFLHTSNGLRLFTLKRFFAGLQSWLQTWGAVKMNLTLSYALLRSRLSVVVYECEPVTHRSESGVRRDTSTRSVHRRHTKGRGTRSGAQTDEILHRDIGSLTECVCFLFQREKLLYLKASWGVFHSNWMFPWKFNVENPHKLRLVICSHLIWQEQDMLFLWCRRALCLFWSSDGSWNVCQDLVM